MMQGTYICFSTVPRVKISFNFCKFLNVPQLFTVESTIKRTQRVFLPTVLICGLVTLIVGCSFVYVIGEDGYKLLGEIDKRSSVHLLMIICAVSSFPLHNLPVYHVIERRVLNRISKYRFYSMKIGLLMQSETMKHCLFCSKILSHK